MAAVVRVAIEQYRDRTDPQLELPFSPDARPEMPDAMT
jgi:hypothetical protein